MQTPAGSSSGSAVSVAAGFAPIALGAETDGSLVQPASRAGLYALKPEPKQVPLRGIMGVPTYDSIGPIAKSSQDVADMLGLLLGGRTFTQVLRKSWTGLKIGFVSYDPWAPAPFVVEPVESFTSQVVSPAYVRLNTEFATTDIRPEQKKEMDEAATRIASLGAKVVRDITLPPFSELSKILEEEHGINPDDLWGKSTHLCETAMYLC